MRRLKRKLNVLVTAGATREPIDPVRFISNNSTGFFGCEIARQAQKRGHRVILISGPNLTDKPKSLDAIEVVTARQMQRELKDRFSWCDCLVMSAAVCDFRPKKVAKRKVKREEGKGVTLELGQNPDILAGLGRRKGGRFLVGFSLETENLKENARNKLREKNLDLVIATQMRTNGSPFGRVTLAALIIDKKGHIQKIKKATKERLARILLEKMEKAA